MRITVTAAETFLQQNGERAVLRQGETVDVPDKDGARLVKLGVAVEDQAPKAQPKADPKPAPTE